MTTTRHPAPTGSTLQEANLFEISGPIVVSYSRSSITGDPRLSYRDGEKRLSFTDREITQVDTPAGEVVTVTLQDVPDAFVRTFTVLVPKISLRPGQTVEFDAVGIETVDRSLAHVAAPGPVGVLQTYRVHDLHGAAQSVSF